MVARGFVIERAFFLSLFVTTFVWLFFQLVIIHRKPTLLHPKLVLFSSVSFAVSIVMIIRCVDYNGVFGVWTATYPIPQFSIDFASVSFYCLGLHYIYGIVAIQYDFMGRSAPPLLRPAFCVCAISFGVAVWTLDIVMAATQNGFWGGLRYLAQALGFLAVIIIKHVGLAPVLRELKKHLERETHSAEYLKATVRRIEILSLVCDVGLLGAIPLEVWYALPIIWNPNDSDYLKWPHPDKYRFDGGFNLVVAFFVIFLGYIGVPIDRGGRNTQDHRNRSIRPRKHTKHPTLPSIHKSTDSADHPSGPSEGLPSPNGSSKT